MKEGDVMKEKNEFDVLENTEQSVTDRLSAEFPPIDEDEKEKVFRMSEKKFNNLANGYSDEDEQSVSGVEIYKRPVWKKCLTVAAAGAVIIGGTAGGIKALKNFTNVPVQEEERVAPFGDFSKTNYKVCDHSTEPLYSISMNGLESFYSEHAYDEDQSIAVYDGRDISEKQRRKLADFFNDYDYNGENRKMYFNSEAQTYMISVNGDEKTFEEYVQSTIDKLNEEDDIQEDEQSETKFEDLTGTDFVNFDVPFPVPYFQYTEDNEVKGISIYNLNDKGTLLYYQFSYEETDFEKSISPQTLSIEYWEIDYDLFKNTITEILGAEEETTEEITTEEPTTEEETIEFETKNSYKFIEYDEYYKIAPFGDLAELEYQVCNDELRSSPRTIDAESVEHAHRLGISNITNPTYLPPCDEISQEQREKLAELFNSWDFDKTPQKSYVYDPETDMIALIEDGETVMLDSMDSEDNSGKTHCRRFQSNADNMYLSPVNPYMIYETADEIRFLSFFKFDEDGYLSYCSIKFEDIDGIKYLFNDTISMTSYAIDYDYFVDTMDAIFDDKNYTIKKGTMAYKGDTDSSEKINPLSGFADKEYWICNSYKSNTDELPLAEIIAEENGLRYSARPRPALTPEKRRELEDFFGSLTWTEGTADDKTIKSSADNDETVTFDMLTDTEFSRIMLNLDNNTISVDKMSVEKQDGGDEKIMTYECTDQSSRSMKLYSTNYPDMREKLEKILGEDFGTNKSYVIYN